MKRFLLVLCLLPCVLCAVAQTQELERIYLKAERAAGHQEWDEAYVLSRQYIEAFAAPVAEFRYTKMLSLLAREADAAGRREESLRLGQQVVDLRCAASDCERRHVATALNELGVYYARSGNYTRSVELCTEALSIFDSHVSSKDPQRFVIMNNLAAALASRGEPGDGSRAVELGEQALKRIKGGTRDYANALNNLVVYYALADNFVRADELSRKALKEGRRIYGQSTADYASMLASHASRLASMRAYGPALQYAAEAVSVFRALGQTDCLAYARLLVNHAAILVRQEDYAAGIASYEEALPLLQGIVGETHADYIRCLSELSAACRSAGDTERAERYGARLSGHLDATPAINLAYIRALGRQAEAFATGGNYAEAIKLATSALAMFRAADAPADIGYTLCRLSEYHSHLGHYAAAIDSGMCAVRFLSDKPALRLQQSEALAAVSMAHYYEHRYDSARVLGAEAVRLREAMADTAGSVYAKSLANLALYLFACDSVDVAIRLGERARRIQFAALGADHPDNVPLLYNLANFYNRLADSDSTYACYHRALQLQTRTVRGAFSHQTSSEREAYWNMKSYVFRAVPVFTYIHQTNDSLLSDAYNALLFTKGLLLNSEINFRNFLTQAGDSVLLARYERLGLLHRDAEACYQLPPAERAGRLAAVTAEAASLEKQLVRDCKAYGDFMSAFDGDWREVAAALAPDEMAVEFMHLDVGGAGPTYAALCLRRGWEAPRMQVLFSRDELLRISFDEQDYFSAAATPAGINAIYRSVELGQLVWGRLLSWMNDVSTVYFAPDGMLYQLGVEYLTFDSLTTVSDRFAFHRLSSTRQVARRQVTSPVERAAVFGGLVYDMNLADIREEHEALKDYVFAESEDLMAAHDLTAELLVLDSLSLRGAGGRLDYLPGTLAEAEGIGECLMQADIPTNMFLGRAGTEEAFKSLGGRRQDIIHVATHGFFLAGEEARAGTAGALLLQEETAGNPLNYAGLLMAGANYGLRHRDLPAGIENGILTAREISLLDLSGTQLVVLSACKTGLGEVREDGVFGLQRGFKKAGAGALLMSLWSVSDEATMVMMRSFYEAYVAGCTRTEAFRRAQQAVRSHPDFGAPFFWASFILLDGC